MRKYRLAVHGVVEKIEGVDVFCWQEIPLDGEGRWFTIEGYTIIGGVGGIGGGGNGMVERRGVVGIMIGDRWKDRFRVLERERRKIGVWIEVGGEVRVEVWSVYLEAGKHERFKWIEGKGNVVVMVLP